MRPSRALLVVLAALAAGRVADAQTFTNEPLQRQIRGWERDIRERKASRAAKDIEAATEGVAPWSQSVLYGTNWSYSWGYLALLTKAWAEQWTGKPIDAYRTLARAAGLRPSSPPPSENDYYYWRWFVSMGELSSDLTRLQDAEQYLQHVRRGLTTNDGFYIKATASLAAVLGREGRLNSAYRLYDEIIRIAPGQEPTVWNDYIEFLFDCGFCEEGVEAILQGAEIHGLSPRHHENDFFAVNARHYWQFFTEPQILRWYEFLGRQLQTTKLLRGTDDLLAFLINTRLLMRKVYPDLIADATDDLSTLRERSLTEKPEARGLSLSRHARTHAPGAEPPADEPSAPPAAVPGLYSTNSAVEDAVHRALLKTLDGIRKGGAEDKPWKDLLVQFDTNQLRSVVVDGVSALFLTYAALGGICAYDERPAEARDWLLKALNAYQEGGYNPRRFGDVLLNLSEVFMSRWINQPDEAAKYLEWARSVAQGYRRLEIRVLSGQAGLAIARGGASDRRIALLQQAVNGYGCLPRRDVYERLARDYYRTGQFHRGFDVLVEGIKRTRVKLGPGEFDHMVDALIMNRSLHSSEELRRLRRIFRAMALRYPPNVRSAATVARVLDLSESSWFGQHEQLARIAESGALASDENWSVITNALHACPSVRAGLLYTSAFLARNPQPDVELDGSGWLAAWRCVGEEMASQNSHAPSDSGGDIAAYGLLLGQLETHASRLTPETLIRAGDAIRFSVPSLGMEQFDRVIAFFGARDMKDTVFALHLARMAAIPNTSVDNPSFQALLGLFDQMPRVRQDSLVFLLRAKRDEAKAPYLKQRWLQALRQCGVEE